MSEVETRAAQRKETSAPEVRSARELPLLWASPRSWAKRAADDLPVFLADHAVCERQAALFALNLVAHYPEDEELVERMTSLAIEETTHLRRVAGLLRRRGIRPGARRPNPYVQALHERMGLEQEATARKVDRLLVGALIEARSCERFTLLLSVLPEAEEREVCELLRELGPAEQRHWRMFHSLAALNLPADRLEQRWRDWLQFEAETARLGGRRPTVHG